MLEFLIIIIAFSGLIIGFFINKFVKEELKPGEKYFLWLKKALILIFIIVLLYGSYSRYIAILLGLIVGYFLRKDYFYIGAGLAGGFFYLRDLIAGLVFLYGLVYAALNPKEAKIKKIFDNLMYFIIPFLLLLISFNYFTTMDAMAFAAGALIWRLELNDLFNKFRSK